MIQDTLQWAYTQATQNPGAKQRQVLNALRFFPDATNAEIAAKSGSPTNRATQRLGALAKQGLPFEVYRPTCRVTGGTASAWRQGAPSSFHAACDKRRTEESIAVVRLCHVQSRAA
jgi:hypothetical protein